MNSARRVWVLNLDAETELETRGSFTPSVALQRTVAAQQRQLIGTLLTPEDVLLTRENLQQHARKRDLEGLEGRAWCPTPSALDMLQSVGAIPGPTPSLSTLRQINARPFALEVRRNLIGDSFDKYIARNAEEVLQTLALPGPKNWLLRRSFGAAGRGRLKVAAGKPSTADLSWIEASLRSGPLTIEPWVEVVQEFTRSGWVSARGEVTLAPPCLQETDAAGAWVRSQAASPEVLPRTVDDRLQEAFEHAGRAIAEAGYHGAFGVDSYLHQTTSGQVALNVMSEINGRYTMDWAQTKITDPDHSRV